MSQAAELFERDWSFAAGRLTLAIPTSERAHSSRNGACVIASGPDEADDTILAVLVTAIYRARSRIAVVTPYFVPGSNLLLALCLAARRGVTVDLVIPARSNHRLSDLVRGRGLRALDEAGARIWLTPGMLHGKLAVVDVLALAGSANFVTRSLFLNYEMMIAFRANDDIRRFAEWFERERTLAQPFVPNTPGLLRDIAEGFLL